MLALLMLPLASTLYVVIIITALEMLRYRDEEKGFFIANACTGAFVAVYWLLLWKKSIRWTSARTSGTLLAAIGSIAVGVLCGWPLESVVGESFGIFAGALIAILLWLAATVFVWRETPAERSARFRQSSSQVIACLSCGYNMTGLREPTCPECGAKYTLDELYASQSEREQQELESGS